MILNKLYASQPSYIKPIKNLAIRSLLMIAVFFSSTLLFATTYYIDPSFTGSNQNGSSSRPYNSWSKVSFASGNTYLQKSGTTNSSGSRITIANRSNITIGAYGSGNKPKIVTNGSGDHILYIKDSYNITVKDIELTSTGSWTSGITIQGGSGSSGNQVRNVYIHKAMWGVRVLTPAGGTKILYTRIHDIGDDGIFAQDVNNIEIGNCTIYDINKKYLTNTSESYAAGDGIQISSTNNLTFNIHHNTIDHSTMGNKACIMIYGNNFTGIIEHNTIIGNVPKNASGIYLHNSSKPVTVRYNTIKNSAVGIVDNVTMLEAYYNRLMSNRVAVLVNPGAKANLRNNVFYVNTRYAVQSAYSTNLTMKNNIFHLSSSPAKALSSQGSVSSNNNIFSQQYSGFINGYASLSAWRNATGNDQASAVGNPGFVNPNSGDFHIQSSSIARNKGSNVNLNRDYFGNAVPLSGYPDAGIHEFGGTKSGEDLLAGNTTYTGDSLTLIDSMDLALNAPVTVIYPNPSPDGVYTVNFGREYSSLQMDVFDISGNIIYSSSAAGTSTETIDLGAFPTGTYIIRLNTEGEPRSMKVVKR
jgi:hypothetical protein